MKNKKLSYVMLGILVLAILSLGVGLGSTTASAMNRGRVALSSLANKVANKGAAAPTPVNAIVSPRATNMANPASKHCIEMGGKLSIKKTPKGEIGICTFKDGSQCEEWAFFRGKCGKNSTLRGSAHRAGRPERLGRNKRLLLGHIKKELPSKEGNVLSSLPPSIAHKILVSASAKPHLSKSKMSFNKKGIEKGLSAIAPRLRRVRSIKDISFRKRHIAEKKMSSVRPKFVQKAKMLGHENAELRGAIKEMGALKKELRGECASRNISSCPKNMTDKWLSLSKEIINISANRMIDKLEMLNLKIEGSERISDDEARRISLFINESIANISALNDEAQKAQSVSEIRRIALQMKKVFINVARKAERSWLILNRLKTGEIIARSNYLEVRLERTLERANESGINVSPLENLTDEFEDLIMQARQHYENAKEILLNQTTKGISIGKAGEAKRELVESHKLLKEANTLLNEIVRELRRSRIKLVRNVEAEIPVDNSAGPAGE